MALEQLEKRLALLEAEVIRLRDELRDTVAAGSDPEPWWEEISGTFADDPTYDEAMRSGREYRESLRESSITVHSGLVNAVPLPEEISAPDAARISVNNAQVSS